jgi:hypothetical protein
LDRLGSDAEAWALAAVVDRLVRLTGDERTSAVVAMADALSAAFEDDPRVLVHLERAQRALNAVDDDTLIEALGEFLHVSPTSDGFGFDVLGFLEPRPGNPPQPLFLEVKSSADRTFIVSRHEWDTACSTELRPVYAFLVVLRGGEGGRPKSMELLPDPCGLDGLAPPAISRTENDWRVSYRRLEEGNNPKA